MSKSDCILATRLSAKHYDLLKQQEHSILPATPYAVWNIAPDWSLAMDFKTKLS